MERLPRRNAGSSTGWRKVKVFIFWLVITSPILFLFNVMGWLVVGIWALDTVLLTLLTRHVVKRQRDDCDSWSGL